MYWSMSNLDSTAMGIMLSEPAQISVGLEMLKEIQGFISNGYFVMRLLNGRLTITENG
jgi:hypothetical protein